MRANFLSWNLPGHPSLPPSAREREASAQFCIILPVHDSPEVVQRCLESLHLYAGQAEVIIVDDGSKLELTRSLLKEYAREHGWILVRNDPAQRHSRACERGCALATRDYICLLNSDTVVTQHCWASVKEVFESDPKIAVVGPMTNTESIQRASRLAGYCGDYWTNGQIYSYAERFISRQPPRNWLDVDHINGFAYFMPLPVWREFGGFHPDLPDYGNETELCHRILAKGYRIVLTRHAYIHHFGEKSIGKVMTREEIQAVRRAAQELIGQTHKGQVLKKV
jgi:GT2 family glycosyltransferase